MKDIYCPKCGTHLLLKKEVENSKRLKCKKCKSSFKNPYYQSIDVFNKLNYSKNKTLYDTIAIVIFSIGLLMLLTETNLTSNCSVKYDLQVYDIIHKEKYSADILIYRELSKSELTDLAYCIYQKEKLDSYNRVFLTYYLPDMKFGSGAWATTHFNPNLKVLISDDLY